MPTDLKEPDAGHLVKHLVVLEDRRSQLTEVRRIVGEMQEECQETGGEV